MNKDPKEATREDILKYMNRIYDHLEQNTYRSNIYGILFYYNNVLNKGFSNFKFGRMPKKIYPVISSLEL